MRRRRKAEVVANPWKEQGRKEGRVGMAMCQRVRSSLVVLRKALGSHINRPYSSVDIYRHMGTRSNTLGLVGGHGLQLRGTIRSSLRIWEQQRSNYSIKPQEIEGPTVERDMSGVAKESREVTESMMKSMYSLSKAVAALGILQLGIGAYMLSSFNSGNILYISFSAVAFGFPFSMALTMRHSLKHMHFFHKMEQIGRLQLLTSTMQLSKHLRLFFLRLRVITYTSLSALLLSFLFTTTRFIPS